MAKFSLLLLDAVVIIQLFEFGMWESFLNSCDVHVSQTIVDETIFYEDSDGEQQAIHLAEYSGKITIHSVDASRLLELKKLFGKVLLDKLDAGEAELLSVLNDSFDNYRICSADAVVFRTLPVLSKSAQGISLEEVLAQIGLSRKVDWPFSKKFRVQYTDQGFREKLTGIILPN